jgi:hypothetical protein
MIYLGIYPSMWVPRSLNSLYKLNFMIITRNLEDQYYEDEKLYSTGDDYLDDLLEKAFCEGYEYAQKEFSDKKEDKKRKDGVKKLRKSNAGLAGAIIAAPITGGGSLSGYFAGKKAGEKADEEGADDYEIVERAGTTGGGVGAATGAAAGLAYTGIRHALGHKAPIRRYGKRALIGAALGAISGEARALRNIKSRVEHRRAYEKED